MAWILYGNYYAYTHSDRWFTAYTNGKKEKNQPRTLIDGLKVYEACAIYAT